MIFTESFKRHDNHRNIFPFHVLMAFVGDISRETSNKLPLSVAVPSCSVPPPPHLSRRTDVDHLKYLIIQSYYQPAPNYLSYLIWSIYLHNLLD